MRIQPHVEERVAQPYVSISIEATFREWSSVNALLPEVFAWLAARGIPPAGAPFYRYWVMGGFDEPFHLEVGVPVPGPLAGDERVKPGEVAAGRYLVYQYQGHPDALGRVHQAIQAWAADNGVEFKKQEKGAVWAGCYDVWLTNPEEEPDPERWVTEVAYQLQDEVER